jgi:hypothetical protein
MSPQILIADGHLIVDMAPTPGHNYWACLGLSSSGLQTKSRFTFTVRDFCIIIDLLKNKNNLQVTTLFGWKERIRQLQSSFIKLNFKHTYREKNKEVDLLSKAALKKKFGFITYNLWVDGHEGPTHVLKSILGHPTTILLEI